jgi:hypothetical protein
MIFVGTRLFGKVHHVPGHFYVATRFAHVNFIPLVPTGSWLVQDGTHSSGLTASRWRGWQLPGVHWRSVGMAWLRFGLATMGGAALAVALAARVSPDAQALALVLTGLAVAGLAASYRAGRVGAEQILELCRELGIPADQAAILRRELTDA